MAKHFFVAGTFVLSALALASIGGRDGGSTGKILARWKGPALRAGAALLVCAVVGMHAANVVAPKPWDYPPLYLAARAAAEGRSLYAPESLLDSHAALSDEVEFPSVYLDTVGVPFNPYLPVTSLLTAPLGRLGYRLSLALHCSLQSAFFLGSVLVLLAFASRLGSQVGKTEGWVLALGFAPVLSAFALAQNVFGALFFVCVWLWLADRRPLAAGAALGAAFPFKHLVLTAAALSTMLGDRRQAAAFAGVVALFTALAVAAFGAPAFAEYARWGTAVPFHHYVEPVAQSLLAVIYRLTDFVPVRRLDLSHAFHPPFLLVATLIATASAVLMWRTAGDATSRTLKRLLALVVALMVYPGSLFNTLPLLLPVFFALLGLRGRLPVRAAWVLGFLALEYGLLALRMDDTWWFHGAFPSMVLAWLFLSYLILAAHRAAGLVPGHVRLVREAGPPGPLGKAVDGGQVGRIGNERRTCP